MKEKEKIILKIIKKDGWLLFSDSDGSCCCGRAEIAGVRINVHCWRSNYKNCDCEYAGVHLKPITEDVSKDFLKELGNIIKDEISSAYMCECKLVL